MIPHFTADAISELVSFPDAVDALESAFTGSLTHIDRVHAQIGGGDFLMMGATLDAGEGEGGAHPVAGTKLVMVQPKNIGTERPLIQGSYVLFDAFRGCPIATMDGAALTNLRTPAITMVAARLLGRPKPKTAVVVGRGVQGKAHVAALHSTFPSLDEVTMIGRAEAVGPADHVIGATSSVEPWLRLDMIHPGTHVSLVGAYRPDMREVGSDVVIGSAVFVDDGVAARAEAGDLILATGEGWAWDRMRGDLSDVVSGRAARHSDEEITLFKSVGLAIEDLVVARLVAHRAGLFRN
jgi:ornithine cyclodeaminase/alanine dehydrogenase-like protein (mu-crystallin family)